MAVYRRSDVVKGGQFEIPKDLYRVRVLNSSFGTSSGGHPMTTLKMEIIHPESIVVNGEDKMLAGRKFSVWLMHNPDEQWGQARVFDFCDKLGIDVGDDYDPSLHKEYFVGMEFDAILRSEENVKRKDRQPGQKQGDPILDGEGKPISVGWNILMNIEEVPEKCNPVKNQEIADRPM